MTTVIAVRRGDEVVMAADSMTNVYDRPVYSAVKIHRMKTEGGGRVLIGVAGDAAFNSFASIAPTLPAQEADETTQEWATGIAAAITHFAFEHRLTNEDGRLDGTLILASRDGIWTITHAHAIHHPDDIAAIGSGEGPAIGALTTALEFGVFRSLAAAAEHAVEIAIRFDKHTDGSIRVEQL